MINTTDSDDNMNFSKQTSDNIVVYNINSEVIDEKLMTDIIALLNPNFKTGLNMAMVKSITSVKFVECLFKNQFKLFNLQSELLTYIALISKDNFLKTFMNYEDFTLNKRELVKRNFSVI